MEYRDYNAVIKQALEFRKTPGPRGKKPTFESAWKKAVRQIKDDTTAFNVVWSIHGYSFLNGKMKWGDIKLPKRKTRCSSHDRDAVVEFLIDNQAIFVQLMKSQCPVTEH